MELEKLRTELLYNVWRLNKTNMLSVLREFIEGESAAMWFLSAAGASITPSQISEGIRVSRARAANILRSLRSKGYVEMEISAEDRRKIDVVLTERGRRVLEEKRAYFLESFDRYIEVMGEENIVELNRILRLTAENQDRLQFRKFEKGEEHQ